MQSEKVEGQILITGCYRTGSEFITQLINCHKKVSATFYTVNFMRFCFGLYDPIDKEENWTRLIKDSLEKLRIRYGREIECNDVIALLNDRDFSYANLYQALILVQHNYLGMTHWAEKTQLVWTKIPDFLHMFPQGKAIHIIRDPRSVLASFKNYTSSEYPRYMGAIFNCLSSMQYAKMYQHTFSSSQYKLVKYEDLAHDTENVMEDIFSFIGLDSVANIFERSSWKDAHKQPWKANTSFGDPAQFSIDESITRWKKNLTLSEIFLCELINKPMMEYFGYGQLEPSVNPGDFSDIFVSTLADKQIASFLSLWATKGSGVECFPSDPFDPATWDDVAIKNKLTNS
jgi:hypothetical protein